jgi:hypothetical protein
VSVIIPAMTRAAWSERKRDLQKAGLLRGRFVYRLSRADYQKEWDARYRPPGTQARLLGAFVEIFPRVGIFKTLWFKVPPPRTEAMFEQSFANTLELYENLLAQQGSGQLQLANVDFDTGRPTRLGEYRMCDDAYSELAILLAKKDPAALSPELRENVLAFFANPQAPYATRWKPEQWEQTLTAVQQLRSEQSASRVQQ